MSVSQIIITETSAAQVTVTEASPLPLVQIGNSLYPVSIVVRQVEAGATGAPGVGIGTRALTTSEALAAGDMVNVWNDSGVTKVRLASALAKGKDASGWVGQAVVSGATATVNFGAVNSSASGLTAGPLWLSTTPGKAQSAAPGGLGQVVQRVGFAFSSTEFMFQPQIPITLSI